MNEDVLHFIWKFRYFNAVDLQTTDGSPVAIIHPGKHNLDQGPDFLAARIQVGNTLWAGNVEIHLLASHWHAHGHSADENYRNVILHVVWENDRSITDSSGIPIPTIELKGRVSSLMIDRYRRFMELPVAIPCTGLEHTLSSLALLNWKERLVVERLLEKSRRVQELLEKTNGHWEEVFWRLIARGFGIKVNAAIFERLAESLPISLLSKHKNNRTQLEALLFGQARLLERQFEDKYPQMLKKEYQFYRKKYGLQPVEGLLQFLRMRPANFPTLRLSQLAALLFESRHLFSKVKAAEDILEVRKLFSVTANDYWHYHYVFDVWKEHKEKSLGRQMVDNILINTVVPVLFSYGKLSNEEKQADKALRWLAQLHPESNRITRAFKMIGLENENAFDSQALYQLKTNYCDLKRCLHCAIGASILGRSALSPAIGDV